MKYFLLDYVNLQSRLEQLYLYFAFNDIPEAAPPIPRPAQGTHTLQETEERDAAFQAENRPQIFVTAEFGESGFWGLELKETPEHELEKQKQQLRDRNDQLSSELQGSCTTKSLDEVDSMLIDSACGSR